ncbi:MAG TPA: hypothetical protein VIK94_02455 [Bacilli bacterium]
MHAPEQMLTPVRVGYTFAGWCKEPITEYPGFEKDEGVTAETYYAKWVNIV